MVAAFYTSASAHQLLPRDGIKMRVSCLPLLAGVLLFAGAGCRSSGQTEIVGADNGSQVALQVGKTLALSLESNPTTGYGWEIAELDQSILSETYHEYEADSPALPGSGGREIWRFKALRSGSMTLRLEYRRPWEEGVEPIEVFSVQVVVQ